MRTTSSTISERRKSMIKPILSMVALLFCIILSLPARAEDQIYGQQIPAAWTAKAAVLFALKNSPDNLIAQYRIAAARAIVAGARSHFSPEIGLSSEYNQTNNPMYSFGNILNQGTFDTSIDFNNPGRTDNLQMKAQAQYRIYNAGRDRAALDAALAGENSSISNLTVVHHQLGYEVVRLFLTIIQDQETVSARESAFEAIRASLAVAKSRYEGGSLLKVDLINLEAQEASASEDLIQGRHTLELSRRGFLHLLGLQTGNVVIDTKEHDMQDPPENLDYSHRPELQVINNAINAAEAEIRKAEGSKYPTMDGFASYQIDKGSILSGSGESWMTGVRINYTLFNGNRAEAGIAEAKARLSELKAQKIKTELALNLELQKADLEYQQADQRLLVTEKMVTVARESARLNRIRFQEGVILSSELIDREKSLTDALVRHSAARTMRQTAIANLRRAVGMQQFD
jgi:outer membrane protein